MSMKRKTPSLHEIARAKRDGNPGCFVTCADVATCCAYGCQDLVARREASARQAALTLNPGCLRERRLAGQLEFPAS